MPTEDIIKRILELYNQQYNNTQIAATIGMSQTTVSTFLRERGLSRGRCGLAVASPETRRRVSSKGGKSVSRDRDHMAAIGRIGGNTMAMSTDYMASIGRLGGLAASRSHEHMVRIGRLGGLARGRSKGQPGALKRESGK